MYILVYHFHDLLRDHFHELDRSIQVEVIGDLVKVFLILQSSDSSIFQNYNVLALRYASPTSQAKVDVPSF